jgi:SpoVK/Ycf46/Vps4 family AAA+-type ATPase
MPLRQHNAQPHSNAIAAMHIPRRDKWLHLLTRIGSINQAPGGVLFHGPPGTGKTMMARALANSCSQGERKISFFMRKGADCLSKYHGEAERQLRLLFEQAAQKQPSIIFFDEIDGLAPVRSSRQDQIHSSIVSTLLALMDGLDKRGMVVCVGATNRPDAVDPALRRPGRFDREFYFPLPDASARAKILQIYTKDWKPPLSQTLIDRMANACVGFGGADMKALCTEAGIRALRRTYPQIYMEDHRLKIDQNKLFVTEEDILDAMSSIKASSRRSAPSLGISLPASLQSPLQPELVRALEQLRKCFRIAGQALFREKQVLGTTGDQDSQHARLNSAVYAGEEDPGALTSFRGIDIMHRPRLILWGRQGDAQGYIARAILQALDPLPVFGIGLQSLYTSTGAGDAKTLEEALVSKIAEARNRAPSVLYLPDYHTWMEVASPALRTCLEATIGGLPASAPVLLLSSADTAKDRTIFHVIQRGNMKIFTNHHLVEFGKPTVEQRRSFFSSIFKDVRTWKKPQKVVEADLPKLERDTELPKWEGPKAPVDPAQQDRNTRNMRGIRKKMRDACLKLYGNRKFKDFQLPVLEQINLKPDTRDKYRAWITHPMDLATLLWEIDRQVIQPSPLQTTIRAMGR